MAERLRTGLQIRVHRFESGRYLHDFLPINQLLKEIHGLPCGRLFPLLYSPVPTFIFCSGVLLMAKGRNGKRQYQMSTLSTVHIEGIGNAVLAGIGLSA